MTSSTKNVSKKSAAARATAKKSAASKKPASKTGAKAAPKKSVASAPAMKHGPRADFGAPIDGFFAKQPEVLRAVLVELRAMVEAAAPEAESALKWGMPFYSVGGNMMCALGAHKAHVNLILSGPPGTFADPKGLLVGDGKTGRHLKLTKLADLPRAEVKAWLKTAAERARST